MADFCVDCTDIELGAPYEGAHDMPHARGWYLCEGCGGHIFEDGIRACRRGPFTVEEAFASMPCEECASFMGTDEGV